MQKVLISLLSPHPDNPKKITPKAIEDCVASIRAFPEMLSVRPIIINKLNQILGGEVRFHALKMLGYTEVDVDVVDWSLEKEKEFLVKDNLEWGEWSVSKLKMMADNRTLGDWGVSESLISDNRVRDVNTLKDQWVKYENADVKKIVLYFLDSDYPDVVAKMHDFQARNQINGSFSDVVEFLIQQYNATKGK